MTPLVPLVQFGWVPLGIAAFGTMRAQTATLVVVIGGWMFLPLASYGIPGFPDYSKTMAVALAAALGITLFAGRRLAGLRFCALDVPMLAWCLVPAASALANGYGPYDAVAGVLARIVEWGLPYLIGRAMFRDRVAIDQLARALFIGGLVYVPFCLYEIRMSPQLHATVYGFAQHSFAQHIRMDGYRPLVFMEHGLMVGLWMSVATVAGFTLWRGGLRRIGRFSTGPLLLLLFATTVLCKSMGALALLALGAAAAALVRARGSKLVICALMAAPVLFVFARVVCNWQAAEVIDLLEQHAPDRAHSVEFRIRSEQAFMPGIWRQPWFGWSAWGFEPTAADPDEAQAFAYDSYWLITAICFGLVGLLLFFCVHFAPLAAVLWKVPVREWVGRHGAGLAALAVAVSMFVIDCMFNAMKNPVYTMVLGALTSFAAGAVVPPPVRAVRARRAAVRRAMRPFGPTSRWSTVR